MTRCTCEGTQHACECVLERMAKLEAVAEAAKRVATSGGNNSDGDYVPDSGCLDDLDAAIDALEERQG